MSSVWVSDGEIDESCTIASAVSSSLRGCFGMSCSSGIQNKDKRNSRSYLISAVTLWLPTIFNDRIRRRPPTHRGVVTSRYKKYCPLIPVGLLGISDGLVTRFEVRFVET